jgi:hypothetical protein
MKKHKYCIETDWSKNGWINHTSTQKQNLEKIVRIAKYNVRECNVRLRLTFYVIR